MKTLVMTTIGVFIMCHAAAQKLVIGEKAPDIRASEWLDSKPGDDGKARLIEFFHTGNKQSDAREKELGSTAKKYDGKLTVIVISKEAADKIKPVLGGSKGYFAAIDDSGKTFDGFGVQFVPFSVLLDKRGRVVWFGNPSSLDEGTIEKSLK